MPDAIERGDAMLFDYKTTYRTDFRASVIKPPIFTYFKKKPTCLRTRLPPLKDIHTLTDWKTASIPFYLLHKPRDIIGIDPRKVQEPYKKQPDTEKENVIKTRPRLVMTPAVSVDDIEDPRAREILCDYAYTSSMTRGTREAVGEYFSVRAPFPGLPAPANPITLPKWQVPYVSPQWRMETVSWDNKQLRSHCDSNKEFWLAQDLTPCRPCQETAAVRENKRMLYQLEAGRR